MTPLDSLVRDHHALVYRVALGVLRDSASAEDVAQDVFVYVLENPSALDGALSVRAVLARAARNRALNARRGEKRRQEREAAMTSQEGADPAEAAFRGELREKVMALPEDQRSAVDLHYFQGMTLPECAAALEIPEGTVSSRISTALRHLRSVLAGAATVALLAALETELSACGAVDIPPGLEGRVRDGIRARRTHPGPTGHAESRRKPAALAAATALLVLIAAWMAWKGRDNPGVVEDSNARTAAGGTSNSNEGPAPGGGGAVAPANPREKSGPVRTADGFLMRAHGGLTLAEPDAGALGGAQRVYSSAMPDFPEIGRAGGWKFADDLRLAGLAASDSLDLRAFLKGDAVAAVPATRLRVRARLRPGDGVREAELLEILEIESLPAPWWSAWRDLLGIRREFDKAWDTLPPGPGRRAQIVKLAEAAAEALGRARAARAAEKAPRRAAMMENDLAGFISARLRAAGLAGIVPPAPDAWDLHDALMEADSGEALRSRVVESWGQEALWLETWAVRSWGDGEQGMQGSMEIAAACALKDIEFRRLHEELHAYPGNRRRAPSLDPVEVAARREWGVALGLDLAAIGPIERERLMLEKGILVVSVTPEGPAAKAGLLPGDVIWRSRRSGEGSPEVVMDEFEAADLVERWAAGRAEGIRLEIVRGERIANLTLGR
ncbi:MAG: sigma-70 family RNA polymerase sigma factor [Planctomycetota bacterium]